MVPVSFICLKVSFLASLAACVKKLLYCQTRIFLIKYARTAIDLPTNGRKS